MGPLISSRALGAVKRSIENATREGARPRDRWWAARGLRARSFPGAHRARPRPPWRLCDAEEVFGPVAAIVRVRDVEEAIALANDSEYGLGANIYTNNLRYVMTAMEEIKAGTFWVNDPLTDNEAGPFGGMRQSGIGRELGEEGLDAFRETKHVHIDYIQERKSYWFHTPSDSGDDMDPLPLYIGGRFTKGAEPPAEIINPATGLPIAQAARATARGSSGGDSGRSRRVRFRHVVGPHGDEARSGAARNRATAAGVCHRSSRDSRRRTWGSRSSSPSSTWQTRRPALSTTGALPTRSPARSTRFPTRRSA